MGVVGEFARYIFFVGLEVALLDVDLGVAADVLFGADAHGGMSVN